MNGQEIAPAIEQFERHVAELMQREDYDGAVLVLRGAQEERGLTVEELLLLARCLQLTTEEFDVSLDEVKAVYQQALVRGPDHLETLIDVGWYILAVEDSAEEALPYFERAVSLQVDLLAEAIEGKAKCLEELKSPEDALQFLDSAGDELEKAARLQEYRAFLQAV